MITQNFMKLHFTFGIMLPLRFLFRIQFFIHYSKMSYFRGIIWMSLFLICLMIEKQKENSTVWSKPFLVFSSTTIHLPSYLNFIAKKKYNSCLPLFLMSWQIWISGKLCKLPILLLVPRDTRLFDLLSNSFNKQRTE